MVNEKYGTINKDLIGAYLCLGGLVSIAGVTMLSAFLNGEPQPSTSRRDINEDGITDVIVERKGVKTVLVGQKDGSYKKLEDLKKIVDETLQE